MREAAGVVVGGLEDAFAVVVAAVEDGAGPFAEEALGLPFDAEFGFFGLGVEEDDFADAAADEGFFADGQFGEAGEEFALNVVGGEGAVVEGFEEEAHGFEEIVFRVDDRVFDVSAVAVEERRHFGEHAQFVHGGARGGRGACEDVCFGSFGHADAEGGDFVVGHAVEILVELFC